MKHFCITGLLSILTALSLDAENTQGDPANVVKMPPLYAMDTCFRGQPLTPALRTPEQQLDLLRQHGYAGISWNVEAPARLAEVAKAASERGVPMFAVYVGADLTQDALNADPRLPEIMKALKGRDTLIWLYVGSKTFKPSATSGDAVAVSGLRDIADLAAANGLRVALYPHAKNWIESVDDAVRLVKLVDRKNLGVTFNLCHSLMLGQEAEIPKLLDRAAPYLFAVTLNGADKNAGNTSWDKLIRPLDSGDYDTAALLRELDRVKFHGPIALQAYGTRLPPEEQLPRSMAAWRQGLPPKATISP